MTHYTISWSAAHIRAAQWAGLNVQPIGGTGYAKSYRIEGTKSQLKDCGFVYAIPAGVELETFGSAELAPYYIG